MYYHGKPVEDKTFQGQNCVQRSRDQGRPSIYHQRAKQGFQFWLEQDPMVKKIARKDAFLTTIVLGLLNRPLKAPMQFLKFHIKLK